MWLNMGLWQSMGLNAGLGLKLGLGLNGAWANYGAKPLAETSFRGAKPEAPSPPPAVGRDRLHNTISSEQWEELFWGN